MKFKKWCHALNEIHGILYVQEVLIHFILLTIQNELKAFLDIQLTNNLERLRFLYVSLVTYRQSELWKELHSF